MPITPLHGLAVLFVYFRKKAKIDPLALTVSATFIDLEPLYFWLIREPLDHRMWHGFALALTIYPTLTSLGVYLTEHFFEEKLWFIYNGLRLKPIKVRYPLLTIYVVSLFGAFSHVFFDMFTHENMPYVIYPWAEGNPFYMGQASIIVEITVIFLAIYSCWKWLSLR